VPLFLCDGPYEYKGFGRVAQSAYGWQTLPVTHGFILHSHWKVEISFIFNENKKINLANTP